MATRSPGKETIMGMEVEYHVVVLGHNGHVLPDGLDRFDAVARQTLRWLHFAGGAMALENGSKYGRDCAVFVEISTAEQRQPLDLVAAREAANETMLDVGEALEQGDPAVARVIVFASNSSYISEATWGVHLNYHYAGDLSRVDAVTPQIVTSIVYSGDGGLDEEGHFLKSRRCPFITRWTSREPSQRGIIDRFLDKGRGRLQFVTANGSRSQVAPYLLAGGTALVLKLIEQGVSLAHLQLDDPLRSLHRLNHGAGVNAVLRLVNGTSIRAIDLCHRIVDVVAAHLDLLPEWSPDFCSFWRHKLHLLTSDAAALSIDYRVQERLCRCLAEQEGVPWSKSQGLATLRRRCRASAGGERRFRYVLRRCQELLTRYFELGRRGETLFEKLEPALQHRLASRESIAEAKATPNGRAPTRARLRSQCVKQFAGRPDVVVDWDSITADGLGVADLSDPLEAALRWRPLPLPQEAALPRGFLSRAEHWYDVGRFRRALEQLRRHESQVPPEIERQFRRLVAWNYRCLGRPDEALAALDTLGPPTDFYDVNQRVMACHVGFKPDDRIRAYLALGDRDLAAARDRDPRTAAAYLGHRAHHCIQKMTRRGLEAGLSDLGGALSLAAGGHAKLRARLLLAAARCHRLLGHPEDVAGFLRQAAGLAAAHRYYPELAYALVLRGTIEADRFKAEPFVRGAFRLYARYTDDTVGICRALCILVRLRTALDLDAARAQLLVYRDHVPALGRDAVLGRILDHWDAFSAGKPLGREISEPWLVADEFWFV